MSATLPYIGFIGLGAMGGPMVANLCRAGYPVYVYDLDATRTAAGISEGAQAAASIGELVPNVDAILTSLPSSHAFVHVAETELLPLVRPGQAVIDLGTVTPPETRRLAARFAAKGMTLIDSPVSGGPGGAQNARLYMFGGGEEEAVQQWRPVLESIGGADLFTYCGPAGSGQVVKGVNQLMMGLVDAAYLEAIAFGVNAGVDIETILQAIGNQGRWRKDFNQTAARIRQSEGERVGVKFRELPYFLHAADDQGFPLPLTAVLRAFCAAGPRTVIDDHRAAPSFWRQLTGDWTTDHTSRDEP